MRSDGTHDETTINDPTIPSGASDVAVTLPERAPEFGARYQVSGLLGAGGMGEVRRCRDHTIGRDVAMKVIRRSDQGEVDQALLARFLREARVQGRLEHPAIVPVYDLGVDPEGTVYFTMKCVRGMSLEAIIQGLKDGDPGVTAQHSRRRLLTAFSSVCLAVDFAHARGVLHRDLKPANVMLGDFGEVYVLDWGLAKVLGAQEPRATELPLPKDEAMTQPGSIFGTPGYMSPEQFRGSTEAVDARTDVYALGSILFELLALEPLHPQRTVQERFLSTITGSDPRPSRRRPELSIPPELDDLCARATALRVDERLASARELSEAIEAYLDGDRNTELRRAAAQAHAEAASRAMDRAREATSDEPAERSVAMREATRAIGFDPANADALRTMVALLAEPPRQVPPEARAELEASSQEIRRIVVSWGFPVALPYTLFLPLLFWMGVLDLPLVVANTTLLSAAALVCLVAGRMPAVPFAARAAIVACNILGMAGSSLVFGPFVLTPVFALSNTIAVVFATSARFRWLSVLLGCLVVTAPFLAQQLGWLPRSYVFHDGLLSIHPRMVAFRPSASIAYLLYASLLPILLGGVFAGRFRDLLVASETRRQLQAWQLRQAVPEQARALAV